MAGEAQDSVVLTHKGLTLNLLKAEISHNGQNKKLTKNEMVSLDVLVRLCRVFECQLSDICTIDFGEKV